MVICQYSRRKLTYHYNKQKKENEIELESPRGREKKKGMLKTGFFLITIYATCLSLSHVINNDHNHPINMNPLLCLI